MMPLNFADIGEEVTIKKVGGNAECKQHLANLGFVPGARICIKSQNFGNLIVSVMESRIALNKELAQKIMI